MRESVPRQVDEKSRAPKEEKGVWGPQSRDKGLEFSRRRKGQASFFFLYIPQSSSHKRFFSLHGILQARILQWEFPSPGDLPNLGLLHFRRVLYL